MITTVSGRLIQNAARHEACSTSQPPITGPLSPPSPPTAAHTAIARRRNSGSGNMWCRAPRVAGISSAAPAPMPHRAVITCHGSPASAPPAEEAPHTATPTTKQRRRPHRSVTAPTARTLPPSISA